MTDKRMGPDMMIEATNFTTTLPDGAVCIRKVDADADNFPPVSVPTFFRSAVADAEDHVAMAVKKEGSDKYTKWTYKEYLDDVETAAKGFIKLGKSNFDRHLLIPCGRGSTAAKHSFKEKVQNNDD